jgi:hypothetical protein
MDFTYDPFPPGQNVRLLRVFQGDVNDEICCELFFHDLNSGYYDALSYTWGDPHPTAVIRLNGRFFTVRRNLYEFLKQYRSSSETKSIWIDAICINQGDDEERSHQVQQMHKIYRNAHYLQIWLGLGSDETDRAMLFLKGRYYELPPPEDVLIMPGLKTIMQRPYWGRTWVLPEIMLMRRLQPYGTFFDGFRIKLLCGTKHVRWSRFSRFWKTVNREHHEPSGRNHYSRRLGDRAYHVWVQ